MSIKETIESAKFPVHKSGGYQCSAVDDLLTDVITQSESLEEILDVERRQRGALELAASTAQTDLQREQERSTSLEYRLAEAQTSPSPTSNEHLHGEIAELRKQLEEFQKALDDANANLKADEEHIASMEAYADEVEANYQAMKTDRDKIRSDAEGAIRTLSERLRTATASSPQPLPSPESTEVTQTHDEPTLPTEPAAPTEAVAEQTPDSEPTGQEHRYVPSITTPTSTPKDDAPTRPRLMRRG